MNKQLCWSLGSLTDNTVGPWKDSSSVTFWVRNSASSSLTRPRANRNPQIWFIVLEIFHTINLSDSLIISLIMWNNVRFPLPLRSDLLIPMTWRLRSALLRRFLRLLPLLRLPVTSNRLYSNFEDIPRDIVMGECMMWVRAAFVLCESSWLELHFCSWRLKAGRKCCNFVAATS